MKIRLNRQGLWTLPVPLLARRDSFSGDLKLLLPRHMDWFLNMIDLYQKYLSRRPITSLSSTNRNSSGVVTLHPWYLCKQNWLCKTVIYKVFKKIEVSSILGRLRPKGLPFSGFRYFYRFFFSGSGIWKSRISCRISLAEAYERTGKCVILVSKRPKVY